MKKGINFLFCLGLLLFSYSMNAADCDSQELLWSNTVTAPTEGALREVFFSSAANQDVSYEIWLPPSYDSANPSVRFPTVYWLHGIGGNQDSGSKFWRRIETALMEGLTPEMIVVGVNGLCNKMYMDSWSGVWPVESMILDVVNDVDANFHTHAYRAARALEGFSMGAFGAIRFGWKYPEMFGLVSSFGGPLFTDVEGLAASIPVQNENVYVDIFDASEQFFDDESLKKLLEKNQDFIRNHQKIRLAYGELDVMDAKIYTPIVHSFLTSLDITHEFTLIADARHLAAEQYDFYELLENLNLFHHYLDSWSSLNAVADSSAPAPVANFEIIPGSGQVVLNWTNPLDSDFQGVRIQRTTVTGAEKINDGVAVFSGNQTQFVDTEVEYGKTYYYTIFAYDAVPNYSAGVTLSVVPVVNSIAVEDGYISECPIMAGTGGELDSTAINGTILRVGDNSDDLQYRSIISFDTSLMPKHATLQSAVIRLHLDSMVGNPLELGELRADIHALGFSGDTEIQLSDFEGSADAVNVVSLLQADDWYEGGLGADGLERINPLGTTQFRIQFNNASDNDSTSDYIGFNSGDSDYGLRPELIVNYSLGTIEKKLSIAAEDGRILESEVNPGQGGSVVSSDSDQNALRVGDESNDLQYVSVISFDTTDIPPDVDITHAKIRMNLGSIQGSETGMGIITVDSNQGGFNGNPILEAADFEAYSDVTDVQNSASISIDLGMGEGAIGIGGRALLNAGSPAQFRLRFQDVISDIDNSADFLGYWSGEADSEKRPELTINYYSGPVFESELITKVDATAGVAYLQSIGGKAIDPDNDAMTFVKLSGPDWLTINPLGTLNGTPSDNDIGQNTWLIRVNTIDGTDVAFLQIDVYEGDEDEEKGRKKK